MRALLEQDRAEGSDNQLYRRHRERVTRLVQNEDEGVAGEAAIREHIFDNKSVKLGRDKGGARDLFHAATFEAEGLVIGFDYVALPLRFGGLGVPLWQFDSEATTCWDGVQRRHREDELSLVTDHSA